MDRRLPPSFRSSASTDASPNRERSTASLNRSHNRPWGASSAAAAAAAPPVGSDSPSRAKYSSLRSSSPVGFGSNNNSHGNSSSAPRAPTPPTIHFSTFVPSNASPSPTSSYNNNTSLGGGAAAAAAAGMRNSNSTTTIDGRGGSHRPSFGSSSLSTTTTTGHPLASSAASPRNNMTPSASPSSAASYNGMDTTTTIDGSRGSVSAGISSYERYRSLRLQAGGGAGGGGGTPTNMNSHQTTLPSSLFTSSSVSPLASASPTAGGSSSPLYPSSSIINNNDNSNHHARSSSPLMMMGSTTPLTPSSAATAATRSSSPRDLRKQRLQQQYSAAASGRSSPYRPQQTYNNNNHNTANESSAAAPSSLLSSSSGRASPFRTGGSDFFPPPPQQHLQPPPPLVDHHHAPTMSIATTTGGGLTSTSITVDKNGRLRKATSVTPSSSSSGGGGGGGIVYNETAAAGGGGALDPPAISLSLSNNASLMKEKKSKKSSSSSSSRKSSSRIVSSNKSVDSGSEEEGEGNDVSSPMTTVKKPSSSRRSATSSSSSSSRKYNSSMGAADDDNSDDESRHGTTNSTNKKKKKSSKSSSSSSKTKRSSSKRSSNNNNNIIIMESSGDDISTDGLDDEADIPHYGTVAAMARRSSSPSLDDFSVQALAPERRPRPSSSTTSSSKRSALLTASSPKQPPPPQQQPEDDLSTFLTDANNARMAFMQQEKGSLEIKQRRSSTGMDSYSRTAGVPPTPDTKHTSTAGSIMTPISAAIRARIPSATAAAGGAPKSPGGVGSSNSSSRNEAAAPSTPSSSAAGVPPKDDKAASTTTTSSVRGWSTYRNRPRATETENSSTATTTSNTSAGTGTRSNPFVSHSTSESSKVSQYLNMRKNITTAFSSATTPGRASASAVTDNNKDSTTLSSSSAAFRPRSVGNDPDSNATAGSFQASLQQNMFLGSASEATTDDDDDDDDGYDQSTSSSSGEDEDDGDNMAEWSVRVCVVSAIDLPSNVVPTVPFSPVLKVGLVRLNTGKKTAVDNPDEPSKLKTKAKSKSTDVVVPPELRTKIHESGLVSVPKARVRSTCAKVMSKRDNGAVEFHEEMRWDANQRPDRMAFAIELSAMAVMTPSNHKESPYEQVVKALDFPAGATRHSSKESAGSSDSNDKTGRLKNLFRRGGNDTKRPTSEMDVAKAAAAVAKHLVEGEEGKAIEEDESGHNRTLNNNAVASSNNPSTSELNVKLLRRDHRNRKPRLTDDIRLGSQIIPISKLSWRKALKNNEAARIEQWFELETAAGGAPNKSGSTSSRNPSVLLEISFSSPEVLDESEDEIEDEEGEDGTQRDSKKESFSRRASKSIRAQLRKEVQLGEVKHKEEEPVLEPGVIDHICVVGPLNIGDQKSDDGASGWVNTNPDCGVLEQFPPLSYHAENGRNVTLPDKVEWFCFPEGCKLWRGTTPPNAEELNLVRFSASSPANIATTIASFDACLGCTTSFSWFVLSSNSDEYGSANTKTFGACIRFFVPAPTGIDPTQDDFGQSIRGAALYDKASKRLWVPIALCMTSHLPIVGAMEVMLLRICEALSSMMGPQGSTESLSVFFEDVASLVINFQRPIPGVVSCSLPFLSGERLHLTLPPPTGLPSLPHGASVTSACRLLQANGINYILAAMLTECKILIHSDDVSNLCLVAEVMTALMYPFQWSLPYIPVLPVPMMEFIEAPLSYLLGIPSSSMRLISPQSLEDVVVIDLDNDFSGASGHVDELRDSNTKTPTPLPASTALNIQKAVYRLLQKSDDNDDDENASGSFPPSRSFPRMEPETLVEREFRIAIAIEIASLVRGYQDCLVIGPSSQPMFNVDKFLQSAPILFDEQRGNSLTSSSGLRVLSPRSRRFISILVTCQHFHQFLDVAESDSLSFFREVMTELEAYGSKRDLMAVKRVLSLDAQKTIDQLNSILKRVEDKVPVYKVKKSASEKPLCADSAKAAAHDFPYSLLCPIVMGDQNQQNQGERAEGVHQISLEYLVELEKNPWRYQSFMAIELDQTKEGSFVPVAEKVKLRDAIGERRYHLWKNSLARLDDEDGSTVSDGASVNQTLDLTALLADNSDDGSTHENSSAGEHQDAAKRRIADAKDRDSLRRCLEQARVAGGTGVEAASDPGRDLVSEAEMALRNESARRFLLAILQKRGSNDAAESHRSRRKLSTSSGASKLESGAFEVLLRLGCAMLDACIEDRDYDSAYALLKLTAGLYSTVGDDESPTVLYMTQRLGHHPIYADLGVWLLAKKMHLSAAAAEEKVEDETEADDAETDEYEAAVATLYEMLGYDIPAEELARFASRVSEENGWFRSERGQSLLLLARRICMRRDTGSANSSQRTTSDIEMMSPTSTHRDRESETIPVDDSGSPPKGSAPPAAETEQIWSEIGWVHPSAQYSSRFEKDVKRRTTGRHELRNRHMKRSAITSMAYLGSSVVVTGGLDGGVFMARNVQDSSEDDGIGVRGIHLDWGSAGSRYSVQSPSMATDGAYGVGAVSILAATQPANQSYDALQMKPGPSRKSVTDQLDEEELLEAMEGCRVVAGTTCGDLRVWSVKDVLSAVFYAIRGNETGSTSDDRSIHRGGEGASSSVIGNRRRTGVDFAAGSSLTRLKFSLRGRALSGHRGGVSCVDVPSHVYRPDSIISGGADGLIKLWSLRSPGGLGRREAETPTRGGAMNTFEDPRSKASRNGDAMSILAGHGGRVLCVKTAWHADRLLSGGADRTVRLWDLAGSGGKCLNSLSGHFGWVTAVKYWGPNTIISASTDRSIALWDARVRNAPLFSLRHHYAPVSDILVGARTDPIMISAGGDGTIAAWDFRRLSDPVSQSPSSKDRQCKVIRRAAGKLYLHDFSSRRRTFGPVLLSRGPTSRTKTVRCLGRDAIMREWDIRTGEVIAEHITGHCDTISTFASLDGDKLHDSQIETSGKNSADGTITTSWDGTVRVRRLHQAC
ncbi:hypothetical protein ACA910_014498 [Epithemia clementina (nom. ined.)]